MNSSDMLQKARSGGYGTHEPAQGSPRSFPLMEEEKVPDGPCCVKVYGESNDGKFVIDRIEPEEGASNEDAIMVKPNTQLSPG